MINFIACLVIFLWASWSVLSRHVDDGIVGKFFYGMAALAALGVMASYCCGETRNETADKALIVFMALLTIRDFILERCLPFFGYERRKACRRTAQ